MIFFIFNLVDNHHHMQRTTLLLVVCLTAFWLPSGSDAKVLNKCDIVRQLTKQKFPRTLISSCKYTVSGIVQYVFNHILYVTNIHCKCRGVPD